MKVKLKAFTIMEVMVAMAITAIVLSLSFYGLRLLHLQYEQYKQQQDQIADARRCFLLLQWDTQQARYMTSHKQELRFFTASDTIAYLFLSNKVIRFYGIHHRDSFNTKTSISNIHEVLNTELGLVDEIELSFYQTEFIKKLHLSKTYSSADLMQWENEY